jgi:hypothetical protein
LPPGIPDSSFVIESRCVKRIQYHYAVWGKAPV